MTKRTAIMRYSFRICRKEAFSSGKLKKITKILKYGINRIGRENFFRITVQHEINNLQGQDTNSLRVETLLLQGVIKPNAFVPTSEKDFVFLP